MAVKLDFGVNKEGRFVHISQAQRGAACNCHCPAPGCERPLVAKFYRNKEDHFAHKAGYSCLAPEEARMTELHHRAQLYILDHRQVTTPAKDLSDQKRTSTGKVLSATVWLQRQTRKLDLDFVEYEKTCDGLRPDLIGYIDGKPLWIEVKVTHALGPEKVAEIKRRDQPTIQIDLSRYQREHLATEPALGRALNNPANIEWVHHSQWERRTSELKVKLTQKISDYEEQIEEARRERLAKEEKLRKDRAKRAESERMAAEERRQHRLALARNKLKKKRAEFEEILDTPSWGTPWLGSGATFGQFQWNNLVSHLGFSPSRHLPPELAGIVFHDVEAQGVFGDPLYAFQLALFCRFIVPAALGRAYNRQDEIALTPQDLISELHSSAIIDWSRPLYDLESAAFAAGVEPETEKYKARGFEAYLDALCKTHLVSKRGEHYISQQQTRQEFERSLQAIAQDVH